MIDMYVFCGFYSKPFLRLYCAPAFYDVYLVDTIYIYRSEFTIGRLESPPSDGNFMSIVNLNFLLKIIRYSLINMPCM